MKPHSIVEEYPPNYQDIIKVFNIKGNEVFTYGNVLYNPNKLEIQEHLIIHEKVHSNQQIKPKEWWDKYLKDKDFRLDQELEAYIAQFAFIKRVVKESISKQALDRISSDLASEMYGNIISFQDAQTKIRRGARALLETIV